MPAKEIKELREAGKIDEAYIMAKSEYEADLTNIWGKRNLSWVLYKQLDELSADLDAFLDKLNEVKALELPETEEMFFENLSIVIAKAARVITYEKVIDLQKLNRLFDNIKELPLKRNSKWFSVLFQAMHKGLKESNRYIEFADWWDFANFRTQDFEKDKLPDGREVMALVEQAYIAYAKHLLPKSTPDGEIVFNKEKAEAFLPALSEIVENYPQFQYPAYFNAKLLLALGDKENILESLLPFVKKKRNDFWVWDILAEACSTNPDMVFACYCRALQCQAPAEMLVNLREKMAGLLIQRGLYNEAKTEINAILSVKEANKHKINARLQGWLNADWYTIANNLRNNSHLYKQFAENANELLYRDTPEQLILVDFVNLDKKILNFITKDEKIGFFKYDRFIESVRPNDFLKVRFSEFSNSGPSKVLTVKKFDKGMVLKEPDFIISDKDLNSFCALKFGKLRILKEQGIGFVDDAIVPAEIIRASTFKDGDEVQVYVIRTYNPKKKNLGWKAISPPSIPEQFVKADFDFE